MDSVQLTIQKVGLQSLIQDNGRTGYQSYGVPISGVMDKSSAKIANWLVGNPDNTPVLEMTLIGATIQFSDAIQIAITGGDLSPKINGHRVAMYETLKVKSGDTLSFGRVINGCRAYLAIRGYWQVNSWLGSSSASSFKGNILTPESILEQDQTLQIIPLLPIIKKIYPIDKRPIFQNTTRVRVLAGPEFKHFSQEAIGFFFSKGYKIQANSNRMGYRLNGTIYNFTSPPPLISSGIIPGTIQITSAGQPIILLADAQTTGGYYRLANVIQADMDKLAQLKPNDTIWFSLVTLEEAYEANR